MAGKTIGLVKTGKSNKKGLVKKSDNKGLTTNKPAKKEYETDLAKNLKTNLEKYAKKQQEEKKTNIKTGAKDILTGTPDYTVKSKTDTGAKKNTVDEILEGIKAKQVQAATENIKSAVQNPQAANRRAIGDYQSKLDQLLYGVATKTAAPRQMAQTEKPTPGGISKPSVNVQSAALNQQAARKRAGGNSSSLNELIKNIAAKQENKQQAVSAQANVPAGIAMPDAKAMARTGAANGRAAKTKETQSADILNQILGRTGELKQQHVDVKENINAGKKEQKAGDFFMDAVSAARQGVDTVLGEKEQKTGNFFMDAANAARQGVDTVNANMNRANNLPEATKGQLSNLPDITVKNAQAADAAVPHVGMQRRMEILDQMRERTKQQQEYYDYLRNADYKYVYDKDERELARQLLNSDLINAKRNLEEYIGSEAEKEDDQKKTNWEKTLNGQLYKLYQTYKNNPTNKNRKDTISFIMQHNFEFGLPYSLDLNTYTNFFTKLDDYFAEGNNKYRSTRDALQSQVNRAERKMAELNEANNYWEEKIEKPRENLPENANTTDRTAIKPFDFHETYNKLGMIYSEPDIEQVMYYMDDKFRGKSTAAYLPEKDKEVITGYYRAGMKDEAMAYYNALKPYLNYVINNERTQEWEEKATGEHGGLYWAKSFATNLMSGITSPATALANVVYGGLDKYNPAYTYTRFTNTVRNAQEPVVGEAFAKNFGETAKILGMSEKGIKAAEETGNTIGRGGYRVTNSVIDNTIPALTGSPALTSAIMGLESAGGSLLNSAENNYKPLETTVRAVVDFVSEYLEELIPTDMLLNQNWTEVLSSVGSAFVYTVKNALGEAIQEPSGEILGTAMDAVISAVAGHQNEIQKETEDRANAMLPKLRKANPNMSEQKIIGLAYKMGAADTWKEWGRNLGQVALEAGLSGGARSGVIAGKQQIGMIATGKTAKNRSTANIEISGNIEKTNVDAEFLAKTAAGMKDGTVSKKLGEKALKDLAKGNELSAAQTGRLIQAITYEAGEEIRNESKAAGTRIISEKLQADGMAKAKADAVGAAVIKARINGIESLNKKEKNLLNTSNEAFNIYQAMVEEGKLADVEIDEEARNRAKETATQIRQAEKDATEEAREAFGAAKSILYGKGKSFNEVIKVGAKHMADIRNDTDVQNKLAAAQTDYENAGGDIAKAKASAAVVYDGNEVKTGTIDGFKDGKVLVKFDGEETAKPVRAEDVGTIHGEAATLIEVMRRSQGIMSDEMAGKAMAALDAMGEEAGGTFADDVMNLNISAWISDIKPETSLPENISNMLWKQAKGEADAAEAVRVQPTTQLKPGEGKANFEGAEYGTSAWTEKMKNMDPEVKQQADIIAELSRMSGMDVDFIYDDSLTGLITDGWFNNDTGKITINLASSDVELNENFMPVIDEKTGKAIKNGTGTVNLPASFTHEFTHWLKVNSREGYKDYLRYTMTELAKEQDVGALIRNTINEYNTYYKNKGMNRTANIDEALDEIMAKASEFILTSDEFANRIKQENPSLFSNIKNYVSDLIRRIKDVFSRKGDMVHREAKTFRYNMAALNEMARIWLGAYDEVINGYVNGENVTTNSAEVKGNNYAIRETKHDKDALIKNRKEVALSKEPISTLTGYEPTIQNDPTHKKNMMDWFESLKEVESDEAGLIKLNRQGVRDSYAHGIGVLKSLLFTSIPEVLKHGKLIYYSTNWKNRGHDTGILAGKVRVENGELKGDYYVGTIINLFNDGHNNYYTHDGIAAVIDKEGIVQTAGPDGSGRSNASLISNILKNLYKYNGEYGKYEEFKKKRDEQYLKFVEGGNLEQAAIMVKQAAEEAGYTMKVYHGTPNGGFNEFRGWNYFTENKKYADRYQGSSASSIRGSYSEARNPMTYELFMNPGRTFDTRNPKAAKVYNKARMEYGLGELSNTDSGLPDWTDGEDLVDFVEENNLPYDTIILDEGADGGYGEEVTKRGFSYVAKSNRVKSAAAVTYDDNGNVIPLSERFNEEKGDIRYSTREMQKNYEKLNVDPLVWFKGTMEQIDAAEKTEAARVEEFKDLIQRNSLMALEFIKPDGRREILSHSIRPGVQWQLSYYGNDGIASMHESYGRIEGEDPGKETVHSMDELYQHFVNENLHSDINFNVLEDDNVVSPASIDKAMENPQKRFSMRSPVESTDKLIAVHNLTYDNLMDTLKEGGFTAPSIAIIRAAMGHSMYGDISVVFKRDAIDPKTDRRNKIYGADAYTPTRYNAQVETELKGDVLSALSRELHGLLEENGKRLADEAERWISERSYREVTTKTPGEMAEDAYGNEAMMAAYLKSQGKEIPMKTREVYVNQNFNEQRVDAYQKIFDALWNSGKFDEFIKDAKTMSGRNMVEKYGELFAGADERIRTLLNLWHEKNSDLAGKSLMKWMREENEFIQGGTEKTTEPDWYETRKAMQEIIDKNEFVAWMKEKLEPAFGQKGIRNNLDPYTPMGNSRSFKQLHKPYTIENVVRAMYENATAKGQGGRYANGMVATASKEFANLQEVREDSRRIRMETQEDYEKIIDGLNERMTELANEIFDKDSYAASTFDYAMIEAGRYYAKSQTLEAIRRGLAKEDVHVTEEQLKKVKALLDDAREIPTGYFEAKPERVVGMNEIETVILPENTFHELTDELDRWKIPYETYDGTEENRKQVLNAQEKAMFSFRETNPGMDVHQWMMSVPENSLQTEAEKELLRQYKSLRMRIELYQQRQKDYRNKIAELEKIENPSKDITRKIDGYKIRIQNAKTVQEQAEAQLANIESSEGYASMMQYHQQLMNGLVSGRTMDEVNEAVSGMEDAAKALQGRIDQSTEELKALVGDERVRRIRSQINSKTLDEAAARIRKKYNSTINKQDMMNDLAMIRLKIQAGQDATPDIEELAGKVLDKRKSAMRNATLDFMKGMTLRLGDSQLKELYGTDSNMKEIRKMLAGSGVKIERAKDGTGSMDGDWNELVSYAPALDHYNGIDTDNAMNQPMAVAQFVMNAMDEQRTSGRNEFADQMDEVIADLIGDVATIDVNMPADPAARETIQALNDYVMELAGKTGETLAKLDTMKQQMDELMKGSRKAATWSRNMKNDIGMAIDYFNKTAKLAIQNAKKQKQDALIQQLKDEHTQKMLKANEEWRNLIERDAKARRQAEDNAAARRKMTTVVSRLAKLMSNMTADKNIPEHMQGLAREIMETFVDADISDGGRKVTNIARKDLFELKRRLDAWNLRDGRFNMAELNAAENPVMQIVNEDLMTIYDAIEKWNGKYNGKNKLDTLQQMGNTLKQMQEATSELYAIIQNERKVALGNRKADLEDAAGKVRIAAEGLQKKEWTGKPGVALAKLHEALVSGNMTPEYFFRNLANAGLTDLWDVYHWAENRNGLELAKAQAKIEAIAEQYGYDKWDTKEKLKLQLDNGNTVEMTLGQLMSLWATWKREQTIGPEMSQHLKGGGFFAEKNLNEGWKPEKTIIEKKANRVTDADMARVGEMLTQEQKDFVDDMVGFMSNDLSKLGNAASMMAYGIKMYKESYYYPFQMWDGIKNRKSNDSGSASKANQVFHPSFSKTRMNGARNAVVIGDFMTTVADHAKGMIDYATMGLANDSFQKVLNFKVQEGYGDTETSRNIRAVLEEAYGMEAMKYLAKLQEQLNGGAVRIDKTFYDKALSLFRKNAVAGSLSVALQQPLSYMRAAMMIDAKYLATGLDPKTWKGSYKEMLAHSGVAVIKEMGRFDMGFGQSAREYLMPEGKKGKLRKTWDTVTEKATILPNWMDRLTWTRIWTAVKQEQHAQHPEMNMKSDEFLDMCGERFNDIMRRTQVYDSVLVKSQNMRSNNPITKSMTSFMAEPTLTLNVLADAVRQAKNHEKGGMEAVAKAGAIYILSAVLQAAVKGLMGAGRNPDDKKTFEENLLYRFGNALISEINPFGLIPGYSDLVTLLKKGELQDDAMGAVGKLWSAGKGTVDLLLGNIGKRGWYRDVEDSAAQIIQLFTNLPAKNIMRDARAMYNFITQPYAKRETSDAVLKYQTNDLVANSDSMFSVINGLLKDAGWQTSNEAYYKRVFEAQKAGDKEKEQDLVDYLLHGKGVKEEKSIYSEVNGIIKKDEDLSAEEKLNMLDKNGYTQQGAFIKEQYEKGKISREEAERLYKQEKPKATAKDIAKALDKVDYEKANGETDSYSNYTQMYEAIDRNDKEAADSEKARLKEIGYEEKEIDSQIKSYISKQYKTGSIDRDKAEQQMQNLCKDMNKDDIWWTLDRIDYAKETGKDAGNGSYYRLWDAMDANSANDIGRAVDSMVKHGLKKENIKSQVTSHYKQDYLKANGDGKRKIRDAIQKAYKKIGLTAEDADKIINKWK